MKNFDGTPRAARGQSKPRRQKKKGCFLPPADGRQGIALPDARNEHMVTIGREAAERYLAEVEQVLPEFWASLRRIAPPQHLGDIEAGFLGRLEQRIRSGAQRDSSRAADPAPVVPAVLTVKGCAGAPLAVGGAAVAALLKQLEQLANMAEDGAIQATSSEGAHQLRCVQELLGSATLIGSGGRSHG